MLRITFFSYVFGGRHIRQMLISSDKILNFRKRTKTIIRMEYKVRPRTHRGYSKIFR